MKAPGRTSTIIDLDHDRLTLVSVRASGGRVAVRSLAVATRPREIDPADAAAMGEWIGREVTEAGMSRGSAVLALSRRDVVLKRLSLPSEESLDASDVAGMVRLQMARQLNVALEGTVLDHLMLDDGAGDVRQVMSGALPGDRMAWLKAMSSAAGLRVRRITLKCFGVLALASSVQARRDGAVLAIGCGHGSSEFVVAGGGQMLFARASDAARPADEADVASFARRIAVEGKRAWMTYRVGQDSVEVESVAAIGNDAVARASAEACGEALELPWSTIETPEWITLPEGLSEADAAAVLPLAGLMHPSPRRSLDFANPRRVPDRATRRRRVALVGLLLLMQFGGVGYLLARRDLGALEASLRSLRATNAELRDQYATHLAEQARLRHVNAWQEVRTHWLDHLRWLSDRLPDPRHGLVNSIDARLTGGEVVFTPAGGGGPLAGAWEASYTTEFTIRGMVRDESMLSETRQRLLDGGHYHVQTIGPDGGEGYGFALRSQRNLPPAVEVGDAR